MTKYINIILEGADLVDVGNSVYYQWGRKDALPGQSLDFYEVSNNLTLRSIYKPIYDSNGNEIQQPVRMGQVSISHSISYPLHQAGANGTEGITWLDNGTLYPNLWNNTASITIATNKTIKTVYDPSPDGYVVAPPLLVRYFNNGASEPTVSNSGFHYVIENGSTALKFPWTLRKNSSGYFDSSTSEYQKEDFLVWFTSYATSPIINPAFYGRSTSISIDITNHENIALPLLPVRQY